MKSFTTPLAFVACAVLAPVALAAEKHMAGDHAMPSMESGQTMPPMTGSMTNAPLVDGVVRKVDKSAGKLTIKHGPIQSLDMPPMTMIYRVENPAMLDRVKPGDKVRFLLENRNGALVITQVEPVAP